MKTLAQNAARSRRRITSISTAALAITVLLGCSPAPGTSTGVTTAALPQGPAGRAASIVLDERQDAQLDQLLGDLPTSLDATRAIVDRVRNLGPWVITSSTGGPNHLEIAISSSRSGELHMQISTDEEGRLAVLSFGPAVPRTSTPTTIDEINAMLAQVSDRAAISVSSANNGKCAPRRILGDGEDALPVGSVSKLIVLSAAMRSVRERTLAWDDKLTLEPRLRTWASPQLGHLADWSTVSVADAVSSMMIASDSTATDLLIDRVRRESLESERARLGLSNSKTPHWTGREVLELGWGQDPWPIGTPAEGPSLDERLRVARKSSPGPAPASTSVVRWTDGLDWFATPADLCSLAAAVAQHFHELPSELRSAITEASSIPAELETWSVAELVTEPEAMPPLFMKLGGTAGVVAGVWVVRSGEGVEIITLQAASTEAQIVGDVAGLHALAARTFALTPRSS